MSAPQRKQTKCRNCVYLSLLFLPRITRSCCGILFPFSHEVVMRIGVTESGSSCFLILAPPSAFAWVLSALSAAALRTEVFAELVVSLETWRIRQRKPLGSSLGVFRCRKWEKGAGSLGSSSTLSGLCRVFPLTGPLLSPSLLWEAVALRLEHRM